MSSIQIPEKLLATIQPTAGKENKLLIAQGAIPMPPPLFVEVLYVLTKDPEAEVVAATRQAIQKIPETILLNIVQTHKGPDILDMLAEAHSTNDRILEKVLINPVTPDSTFLRFAKQAGEKQATLIANNQVRLLRTPAIAENLKKNPNMLKSELDRMVSFLKMNGIVLEGDNPELSLQEIESILALQDNDIPPEFLEDTDPTAQEKVRQSVYQYIQTINTGQKIKLALKGNKEARSLLIKESNKVISVSVIKNPRITDSEVLAICNNRTINDEILRIVCMKSDWIKHYSIQYALANNPKTPFQNAVRFTKGLSPNDLKKLSKNKNANSQLQKMAKEMYLTKRK